VQPHSGCSKLTRFLCLLGQEWIVLIYPLVDLIRSCKTLGFIRLPTVLNTMRLRTFGPSEILVAKGGESTGGFE
jgi:hypothetical protein